MLHNHSVAVCAYGMVVFYYSLLSWIYSFLVEIKILAYQIICLLLLTAFYSIYFLKMIVQKKQGIQTDQIAKGNKQSIMIAVEMILKIATNAIVIVELASIACNTTAFSSAFRIAGIFLVFLGVITFGISVYTMSDSWRAGIPECDNTKLIQHGIYRVSRNPAFLGFYLTYLGILLVFFNWLLLLMTLLAMLMLHLQILQEENHLKRIFGRDYLTYQNRVGRYIGVKKG